jgi:putative tricarboxylic transport membrane protein
MVSDEATRAMVSIRQRDRWADIAVGLAFAALGVAIVVVGELTLHEDIKGDLLGPLAFPRVLGSCMFAGGLYVAIRALRRSAQQVGVALEAEGDEDEPDISASTVRAVTVMALTLVYGLVLNRVGYLLATPVFVAAALYVLAVRSKIALAAVSLLLTAFCYYIFAEVLKVPLPSGVLTEPLRALGWIR